jgi:hypothetical protein
MFHKSQLGSFGENIPSDLNGMVPERGDDWRDFNWDSSVKEDLAVGDDYSEELWEEMVAEAEAATEEASKGLDEWRSNSARFRRAEFSTEAGIDVIVSALDTTNSQIEEIKATRDEIIETAGKSKEVADYITFLSDFQSRQEALLEFLTNELVSFIGADGPTVNTKLAQLEKSAAITDKRVFQAIMEHTVEALDLTTKALYEDSNDELSEVMLLLIKANKILSDMI